MNPYILALITGLGLSCAICVPKFRKKKLSGVKGAVLSAIITTVLLVILELANVLTDAQFDLLDPEGYWLMLCGGAVVIGIICSSSSAQYRHSCEEKVTRVNQANYQINSLKEKIHTHESNIQSSKEKEKSIQRQINSTQAELIFACRLEHFFHLINNGTELSIESSVVRPLWAKISDDESQIMREKEYRLEEEAAIDKYRQEIITQRQIVAENS